MEPRWVNNIQDSVGKAENVKQTTDDDKTNSPLNHEWWFFQHHIKKQCS